MIKVQTLRLSGFCAATMLALAACSSAPNTPETNGAGQPTADHNAPQPGNAAPGNAAPGNAAPGNPAAGKPR